MNFLDFSSSSLKKNPEIWIGAFAFIVRLWFLQKFQDSLFFEPILNGNDRALYDGLAQQIARGQIFPSGAFEHMPLYPWVLGLIYFIFGPNLYLVGLLGSILDASTILLMIRLARRMGAPIAAAGFIGILYAFYPTAIIYSVVTMPNSLNAFLLVLFTTACLKLWDEEDLTNNEQRTWNRITRWFRVGFLAGIITLGFAGMSLIAVSCFIFWVITHICNKSICLLSFVFCLTGFALPIIPVTLHNWRVEHRLVWVSAHGGFNFYMGNHENATGYPVQIRNFRGDAGNLLADAHTEAERIEGHKLTAAESSKYWTCEAWKFIRKHPAAELKLFGVKFLKFWNYFEYDDLRLLPMFRLTRLAFTSPFWPGFGWFAWFGLCGLLLAKRCGFIKILTFSGILGILGFFVTARYRLTFVPLFGVLGAITLGETWNILKSWWENRNHTKEIWGRSRLLGILVTVIGVAFLICWPLPQSDFRALDYYNTAAYLIAQGKPDEAIPLARQGIALAPGESNLYFVMGNALFGSGKLQEAVDAYEITLRLKPTDASAHYNLAVAWMQLGKPISAIHEAALALHYNPVHSRAKKLIKEAQQQTTGKN